MFPINILLALGLSYTLSVVLVGGFLIGLTSGIISVLFVNQKKSIYGDTISHATFPGIAIVFLLSLYQQKIIIILGGLISALLAVAYIQLIINKTKLKIEVAIAISLSTFVGVGLLLFTYIQFTDNPKSGLSHYLFGNLAFLRIGDLQILYFMVVAVLLVLIIFYKEFKLLIFDPEYAKVIGHNIVGAENILLVLITIVTVINVENIGVILVTGLLIAPAIIARYWSNTFKNNLIIGSITGAFSAVLGVFFSATFDNVSPAPVIIMILTFLAFISILFGSNNSVFIDKLHNNIFHRTVDHNAIIREFLEVIEPNGKSTIYNKLEIMINEYPISKSTIIAMKKCGYCKQASENKYIITVTGLNAIKDFLAYENVGV